MKVFLSGINPSLDVEGKLRELGHEPLVLTQSANSTGNEGSSTSIINESEAIVCDMTVKRGIEDHRYASSKGIFVISLYPEEFRNRPRSLNIDLMSTPIFYSHPDEIKPIIGETLKGNLKSKESESRPSKERR